jgi:integrase
MPRKFKRRGPKEGTIVERADRRWMAAVHLGWSPDGKRRRKFLYGKTREEVAAKLEEEQRNRRQGIPPTPGRLTVGAYLATWLENVAAPSLRPSTLISYRQIVSRHLNPSLGRMPLAQLEPDHVVALMRTKSEEGLSPRTVTYIVAVLRAALQQALRAGKVARNVAAIVRKPKVERTPVEPLDLEQTRALLSAASGERLEAPLRVAIHLGLRLGELLALRWCDVDFESARLRVAHTLHHRPKSQGGGWQLAQPKSKRSRRVLPLAPGIAESLRAHRKQQLVDRLEVGPNWQEHDFVFASAVGTPLEERNVRREFYRLLDRAGLPAKRLHDLRHGTATLMLASGASPRAVMEQLGHSQISLTMDTYAHVLPDVLRREAEGVEKLLEAASGAIPNPVVVTAVVKPAAAPFVASLDAHRAKRKRRHFKGLECGPPETRTPDPLIKSQLLYHLS